MGTKDDQHCPQPAQFRRKVCGAGSWRNYRSPPNRPDVASSRRFTRSGARSSSGPKGLPGNNQRRAGSPRCGRRSGLLPRPRYRFGFLRPFRSSCAKTDAASALASCAVGFFRPDSTAEARLDVLSLLCFLAIPCSTYRIGISCRTRDEYPPLPVWLSTVMVPHGTDVRFGGSKANV